MGKAEKLTSELLAMFCSLNLVVARQMFILLFFFTTYTYVKMLFGVYLIFNNNFMKDNVIFILFWTIFMCTVQWHWVHSHCCAILTIIHFPNFHLPKQKLCTHQTLTSHPPPPHPWLLASTSILSDSTNLTILGICCKWNQTGLACT